MGLLVDGQWQDKWYDTKSTGGKFERQASRFHHSISHDGLFQPEVGRYHLYVAMACPWAHRTLIFRTLKQLENVISVSVVSPDMLHLGWQFEPEGQHQDHLHQSKNLYEIYQRADEHYTGRVTVPILWDKKTHRIVNNESSEIIRIFNSAFNEITGNSLDFYPEALRADIDEINHRIYHSVNNGVYKCGFATTQAAYEEAFDELFNTLDFLENRLSKQRYLLGNQITEADWRLFTTLVRFDSVYVGHFKTNRQRIVDYPNLWAYTRELYQYPGVANTVDMRQIKRHYYFSHTMINPTQVVPKGPEISFDEPHKRNSN